MPHDEDHPDIRKIPALDAGNMLDFNVWQVDDSPTAPCERFDILFPGIII
jgi:hypothetical protein